VSYVLEKKGCLHNERCNTWCGAVVRGLGCPAEHRGSLDLLAPSRLQRDKRWKTSHKRITHTHSAI
jgi:hypothetical protein